MSLIFFISSQMSQYENPPWNFSWVVQGKLAAMAWPQTEANLEYVINCGIKHLVTLSPEKLPPVKQYPALKWTLISIQEFEAPTLDQMKQFLDICEDADKNGEVMIHTLSLSCSISTHAHTHTTFLLVILFCTRRAFPPPICCFGILSGCYPYISPNI